MILTLTPNPTIDRVYYLSKLEPNSVHRAVKEVASASGKGVDASTILALLGEPTIALGLSAGRMGQVLAGMLDDANIPHDFVAAHGETRTVPVLVDQHTNTEYTITAPTLMADDDHLTRLGEKIEKYAQEAWGIIFAGSLPSGMPADSYAWLLQHAYHDDLITLLDVSGESLAGGIAGLPHILKINHRELAKLDRTFAPHSETIISSQGKPANLSVFAALLADQLGTLARDAIIISMGKWGALAVTNNDRFFVSSLSVPVAVTTGAGDAMDAGIMLARKRGQSWREAVCLGTAAAAAAVMHEATAGCDPAKIYELLPQVVAESL